MREILATVVKRSRTSGGKVRASDSWYLRYKLPDMGGFRLKSLGCRDRQVADAKCLQWLRDQERESVGLLPSSTVREAVALPLRSHLDDFIIDLETKGRASMYC